MADINYQYKPGDYILTEVIIAGSTGRVLDVTDQVLELIIYEDITSSSMSGSLLLDDNSGIYQSLPIIGQEKIAFKVTTPGYDFSIDFSQSFGYIYDVEKRTSSGEHSHVYLLNWTTNEALLNIRTRVSQSFKGLFSEHVQSILRDKRYLNSKKPLFIEETKNERKFVVPNIRPFKAIKQMAEESLSKKDGHSNYLFFETSQGYHYRSFDSLLGRAKANIISPTTKIFRSQPVKNDDPMFKRMAQILEFEVLESTDTLISSANGMYSSTLLQHDIFNKQLNKYIYNYFDNGTTVYTNSQSSKVGSMVSESNIDNERDPISKQKKTIADYSTSTLFIHPSGSSKLHTGGKVDNNAKEWLQYSASRHLEQNYFQLQFLTHGDTSTNVGDVIFLRIPSNKPLEKSAGSSVFDPILSGRYVITNIKHAISHRNSVHGMTIRCVKDSVADAFGSTEFTFDELRPGGTIPISDSDYRAPSEVLSEQAKL